MCLMVKKLQFKRKKSDLRTNLHGYAREAQNGSMQCARTHTIIWLNNRQLFWKANTCVNLLDDDIVARNETKVKVYLFYYYYSFLSIDSVFSCNWLNFKRHCYHSVHKNLYLAHYIFRTILVAVRFIKVGKTLAIHKKTCLLHVYDKRTGLRLLSVS